VVVRSDRYSARSAGTLIESNTQVVILDGDNGGFLVAPASDVLPGELPNAGTPVYSNFGAVVQAEAIESETRMEQWRAERQRWLRRVGPSLGAVMALVGLALAWRSIISLDAPAIVGTIALAAVGGAAAGWQLLRVVDGSLQEIDFALHRFSVVTTGLALFGGIAGAAFGIPQFGLSGGSLTALAGATLLGLPLPVLLAMIAAGEGAEVVAESGDGGVSAGVEASPSATEP
jgi:hypothetical protein